MARSERWRDLERYLGMLSSIAVILGVPIFFYQQYQSSVSDAEKATLSYVQRFQDNDFFKARLALFDEWKGFPVGLMHADLEATRDFAEKDMNERRRNHDRSIDDALFRFEAFFGELAQCVDKGICSKDVSTTYFQDFAHRLICLYEKYYHDVEQELGVKGFGAGVRKIAADGGKCSG